MYEPSISASEVTYLHDYMASLTPSVSHGIMRSLSSFPNKRCSLHAQDISYTHSLLQRIMEKGKIILWPDFED